MVVGLFGRAFGFRGRIREGKDDWQFVDLCHRLQHFGRESATDRRHADDRGGFERADSLQEVVDRSVLMCIGEFLRGKARAALHDQTSRIYKPVVHARVGFGYAFSHHGRDHEVGDFGRSLARAEKKHLLVGQLTAGNAQCREQTRERDRSRSLNIVIEDANLVAIFVQKMEC